MAIYGKQLQFFPSKKDPLSTSAAPVKITSVSEKASYNSEHLEILWKYAMASYTCFVCVYMGVVVSTMNLPWALATSLYGLVLIIYYQPRHVALVGLIAMMHILLKFEEISVLTLSIQDYITFVVIFADTVVCVAKQNAYTRTRSLLLVLSALAIFASFILRFFWTSTTLADILLFVLLLASYVCVFQGLQFPPKSVLCLSLATNEKTSSMRAEV